MGVNWYARQCNHRADLPHGLVAWNEKVQASRPCRPKLWQWFRVFQLDVQGCGLILKVAAAVNGQKFTEVVASNVGVHSEKEYHGKGYR